MQDNTSSYLQSHGPNVDDAVHELVLPAHRAGSVRGRVPVVRRRRVQPRAILLSYRYTHWEQIERQSKGEDAIIFTEQFSYSIGTQESHYLAVVPVYEATAIGPICNLVILLSRLHVYVYVF